MPGTVNRLVRPRCTRWGSTLADPVLERRYRQHALPFERQVMVASAIALVVVGTVVFGYRRYVEPETIGVRDVTIQAALFFVLAAALWVRSVTEYDVWRVVGPAFVLATDMVLAALLSIEPFVRLGGMLQIVVLLLLYLTVNFTFRVTILLAVLFSAVAVPLWAVAALHGSGTSVNVLGGVLVIVVVHVFGIVEARRNHRARRRSFARERTFHELSVTDELTGLANRRRFTEVLDERLDSDADGPLLVMIADLDGFKDINDTFGHPLGDELLRHVSARLRRAMPDAPVLARLGGDEFAAVLHAGSMDVAIQQFLARVRDPIDLDGVAIRITASIGIASGAPGGCDRTTLLQRADVALYRAKAAGGGTVADYVPELDCNSRQQIQLMSDLTAALDRSAGTVRPGAGTAGRMELHYQPKADAATGAVDSVEALVRWRHPTRGVLPPAEFLPHVNRQGLMPQLTKTVVFLAFRQAVRWRLEGNPLRIAVNLSPGDFQDPSFPSLVAELAAETGAFPDDLQFELTEDSVYTDQPRVLAVAGRLHEAGYRLSLDDYGVGYSSLMRLRTLPVDELKIDRAFVSGVAHHAADTVMVRSTIEMAHTLGFRVVGEGVEDAETWDALAGFGCDVVQGYFLSKPLPAREFECWLRQYRAEMADPGDVRRVAS